MKYGETLRQRSIPEWGHYNIDYDEIKRLIKEFTTPGSGKAVSIPGQGNTAESDFETVLYLQLVEEYNRVNLFVKSKYGEIERKLDHFSRQVARLEAFERSARAKRNSVKRIERYARIEGDILKVGQEIKCLSQFTNVQKLAWKKLLKKYKKWTGSDTLGRNYTDQILNQPDSFWSLEIDPLMNHYTDILHTIRAGYQSASGRDRSAAELLRGVVAKDIPKDSKLTGFRSPLQTLLGNSGSTDLDFDDAISLAHLGPDGGRALYWVHPDNLIELQVLLLQHLCLFIAKTCPDTATSQSQDSPVYTPRREEFGTSALHQRQDERGCILMDDIERFVGELTNTTVGDSEDQEGRSPSRSIAHARWTSDTQASVTIQNHWEGSCAKTARLNWKNLAKFLDIAQPYSRRGSTASNEDVSLAKPENLDSVRDWLASHPQVRCLASVCSKRTRFTGLSNDESSGVWATLDTDLAIKSTNLGDLSKSSWREDCHKHARQFPHAVLEVRHEGNSGVDLIKLLDDTHLTERVRGFNMETHAIWVCRQPQSMVPPLWLSALNKDIRKIPGSTRRQSSLASKETSPIIHPGRQNTSTSSVSVTDFQTDANVSSAPYQSSNTSMMESTDALHWQESKNKRKGRSRRNRSLREADSDAPSTRYWSEYDHPEDEEDSYVIYVDPDAPVTYPGEEALKKLFSGFRAIFKGNQNPSYANSEGDRLITSPILSHDDDSSSSSDEGHTPSHERSYGTLGYQIPNPTPEQGSGTLFRDILGFSDTGKSTPPPPPALQYTLPRMQTMAQSYHDRERTRFRLYVTSLLASAAILLILITLAATGRKRMRSEIDVAVVFGMTMSLFFAMTGVAYMLSRKDTLGWLHRAAVFAAFISICIFNGLLIGWVLG